MKKPKQKNIAVNNFKKAIFILGVLISTFLSAAFFSSASNDILYKIIFGFVGILAVLYAAMLRREYHNKKRKHLMIIWGFCTAVSYLGTMGCSIATINKQQLNNAPKIAKIKMIDDTIKSLESNDYQKILKRRLARAENKADSMMEVNSRKMLVAKYDKKIENISKEIYNNKKNILEISKLRIEKAQLLKSQNGMTGAIRSLSELFNIKFNIMAQIVLNIIALIIELAVFSSSTYDGKLFVKIKFPKKKKIVKVKSKRLSKIQKEILGGQGIFDLKKVG